MTSAIDDSLLLYETTAWQQDIPLIAAYSCSNNRHFLLLGTEVADTLKAIASSHSHIVHAHSDATGLPVPVTYKLDQAIRAAARVPLQQEQSKNSFDLDYRLETIALVNPECALLATPMGDLRPLWQQGQQTLVKAVCLRAVMLTKAVLKHGLEGTLLDPNTGRLLLLRGLEVPADAYLSLDVER